MGLTYTKMVVSNPSERAKNAEVRFLVDTGALFSVLPMSLLRRLGVHPLGKETVLLADGRKVRWSVGEVRLAFNGRQRTSPVLFGKKGTTPLLGVVSLKILGLSVDTRRRKLVSTPLIVA